MRVLVVGGGGREHAIVWKLNQSPNIGGVYVWPGNAATREIAKPLPLTATASFDELANQCIQTSIDLVVVGPEGPLSDGIADVLTAHGLKVFGPTKQAAQLESSKTFAKKIMMEAGIPTASFEICRTQDECRVAAERIFNRDGGVVLKASGLAAGKGVFVCQSEADISDGLRRLYTGEISLASTEVVVEELLFGRECSYFCFLGTAGLRRLGFAVDHKRLKVGDKGPNTGGMGCYTPVPWLPKDACDQVEARIVEPLIETLKRHGIEYTGCLYVGVMWSDRGPAVIEFNVRFGDPEAQVLALSDSTDWLPLMLEQVGLGTTQVVKRIFKPVIGYVLASSGYPYGETKDIDQTIPASLLTERENESTVFQASVKSTPNGILTGSGRVLLVAGTGKTFASAKSRALVRIHQIRDLWPDCQWRPDIGLAALQHEEAVMSDSSHIPIILGSSSPRRKELLSNLGLEFSVVKPETEEKPLKSELPIDYVQRNAREKNDWICHQIRKSYPNGVLIISADTVVVVNDILLEKPTSEDEAKAMLGLLSGKKHTVYTAVTISRIYLDPKRDLITSVLCSTDVTIKSLSRSDIDGYVATKEPFDKAGGYAAQGLGSFMVERLEGSFSNVVGLPLAEVSQIISKDFGIPLWRDL